jgi:hypothetical protein
MRGTQNMTNVSENLVNHPAIAAALQPPHFHVLAGLPGLYMPDSNEVYRTLTDARAGLLEYVERNDQDYESDMEVSYQTVDHVQWSDGNFRDYEVYVETVCTEPECLTELDSA